MSQRTKAPGIHGLSQGAGGFRFEFYKQMQYFVWALWIQVKHVWWGQQNCQYRAIKGMSGCKAALTHRNWAVRRIVSFLQQKVA